MAGSDYWIPIIISLITGGVSLVISIISAKKTKDLESFKFKLDIKRAEQRARIDYEYEARKHLYHKIEPLLSLLSELSEGALHRIFRLSITAKEGTMQPFNGSLSSAGYFLNSTIYKLIVPMAAFKLIQRRLTLFDLSLDPYIQTQYSLAKRLYFTFSDSYELAKPDLEYYPYEILHKQKNPHAEFTYQGIQTGLIDKMTDALILYESSETPEIMNFGEFERKFLANQAQEPFETLGEIFLNFHPKTKPVLWRILIAQVHIYRCLIDINKMRYIESETYNPKILKIMQQEERLIMDWRQSKQEASDDDVLIKPFNAAENYLRSKLGNFMDG